VSILDTELEKALKKAKASETLDDGTAVHVDDKQGNSYEVNLQNQSKHPPVDVKWQDGKKVVKDERKEAASDLNAAAVAQKAIDAGQANVAEGKKAGAGNALAFHNWGKDDAN